MMMDKQSKTPLTDALVPHLNLSHGDVRNATIKLRNLARELEAENAELRRRVADAKSGESALLTCIQMACDELGEQVQPAFLPDLIMSKLAAAQAEIAALKREKDIAYTERDQCVAALTKLFPSTKIEMDGWSDEWHWCVYIALPTGQVSWHFHDSNAHLFDHVKSGGEVWDGHNTPEKYRRLAALDGKENAALREDAELGKILLRYIDRLNDPTDTDTLEVIVGELSAAVATAIDAARKEQP